MPKVKFKKTGEEADVAEGMSLKDVTRDKGWPVVYGCEDGVCGTCIIKIEDGGENLSEVTEQEKQTLEIMGLDPGKYRLACQCKVQGDCVIDAA